jgi:hypothetical protein
MKEVPPIRAPGAASSGHHGQVGHVHRQGCSVGREERPVDIRWLGFGAISIDGTRYERDVVIDAGRIRRRHKAPSKRFRDAYGHTPLSADESIPWGGDRLIVGTGADGQLPVMDEVRADAARRGVALECLPTEDACGLLGSMEDRAIHAILHVTC